MRVVFDTNIFVSALVRPGGPSERALLKIIEGPDQLIVSRPLIHELLAVLARKFSRDQEELARVAVYISELGELVEPRERITALSDEPDNRVLECAGEGYADAIVTGDRAMLDLREFSRIPIIRLRTYCRGSRS